MKVIGITGGIGSGKSLVTKILREKYHGVLLDTDQMAKEQMEIGGISYQGVVDYFGEEILRENGSIDRGRLAEIAFQDEAKLQILNQLTHPNVIKEVKAIIEQLRNKGDIPYVIMETALMIEAKMESTCDEVWYVYSSEQDRRKRLKATRNYSDEKISHIFSKQKKEEEFLAQFSIVIKNTGDYAFLEEQVKKLLGKPKNKESAK